MSSAAGVLFTDDDRRILLVQTSYKQHWDIPGGITEPGETPRQAATREVKEEIGVDCTPGRLLIVDTVLRPSGDLLTAFVFNGGHLDTSGIRLDPADDAEVIAWAWCDLVEHIARTQTAPIFQARIMAAKRALISGYVEYLESRPT